MVHVIDGMTQLAASKTCPPAISAIRDMSIGRAKVSETVTLALGLPPVQTPEPIRAAAVKVLENEPAPGTDTLPGEIPDFCEAASAPERRAGQRDDSDRGITIPAGDMRDLNTLRNVLIGLGDEAIVAHRLLDKARVAVTRRRAFGPAGQYHVPMAPCVEGDVINADFDRMEGHFGQ